MSRVLATSRRALVGFGAAAVDLLALGALVAVASGLVGVVAAGPTCGRTAVDAASSTDPVSRRPLDAAPAARPWLALAGAIPRDAADRCAAAGPTDPSDAVAATPTPDPGVPTAPGDLAVTVRAVDSDVPPAGTPDGSHAGIGGSACPVGADDLEEVVYDLSAAFGDAARRAASDTSSVEATAGVLSAVRDALAPFPGTWARLEGSAGCPRIRVHGSPSAISAVETTLDRVAALDGPVASLCVESFGPADATGGAVASLVFDVPWSQPACATGGRARLACGDPDLEVSQEWDGPVFDVVRNGLRVNARWERAGGGDALRVELAIERSFARTAADGVRADVEVAQDTPLPPPEFLALLMERAVTRGFAAVSVPAVVGGAADAACGEQRLRVTVVHVDEAVPIRRGWERATARLAAAGYVPPDVEQLTVVVDRPEAVGGEVAGDLDLVDGRTAVLALDPSRVRDADLGDAGDPTVRVVAAAVRSLTAPLVVHATASGADPDRSSRAFDVCLTIAGDDVTWSPMDVPPCWDSEASRRGDPIVPCRILRPTVTSVVVPLRLRMGVGGEVRRTLSIDRGRGPERWEVTVVRRLPPRGA